MLYSAPFYHICFCAGSKLRSDQFRFGHMLAELQRQPVFQLREFETTIDSIRDCVAEVQLCIAKLKS